MINPPRSRKFGLDEDNIGLIAVAVLRANGRGGAAAGVGGVEGR